MLEEGFEIWVCWIEGARCDYVEIRHLLVFFHPGFLLNSDPARPNHEQMPQVKDLPIPHNQISSSFGREEFNK